MNRMIRLFQVKSNAAFEKYLLERKKLRPLPVEDFPAIQDVAVAVLKCESDIWAKAAELLRKEELNR